MNILVTGSRGFIAKAFCKKLSKERISVVEFDLPERNILGINNILVSEPVHMLVHMAAIADLNDSLKDQDKNFQVNVRGTYEVAKFCVKNHIPLIFISTACVYHSNDDIVDETTFPLTDEPYACSKMAGEYILRGMPGLDYSILRIGTVYGEGMRKELFNYTALDKAIKGEQIKINGDGNQERTYIYIDDLVEGIYQACIQFKKCNKEIINLCGNENISVMQTISTIAKMKLGKSISIKKGYKRYGDFQHENVSIEKAEKLLSWKPQVSYEEGMKRTYKWLKTLLK